MSSFSIFIQAANVNWLKAIDEAHLYFRMGHELGAENIRHLGQLIERFASRLLLL